jgi:predicted metal-dependent hydrolase
VSITAIVEDDTIKLPPGVHLPNGTEVRVELPPELPKTSIENWLATAIGAAKAGVTTDEIMKLTRDDS